jgi:hypothetical protein
VRVDVEATFQFEKADSRGGYVRGFAYLTKDKVGQPVTDYSGQFIEDMDVLREAAHDFMDHRIAKAIHGKTVRHGAQPVGDIVESIIIDDDVAKALGMTDMRRGWYIGMRVHDETVQKRIRSGELTAFSIGGRAAIAPESARLAA